MSQSTMEDVLRGVDGSRRAAWAKVYELQAEVERLEVEVEVERRRRIVSEVVAAGVFTALRRARRGGRGRIHYLADPGTWPNREARAVVRQYARSLLRWERRGVERP